MDLLCGVTSILVSFTLDWLFFSFTIKLQSILNIALLSTCDANRSVLLTMKYIV
jgi:hypothetical protein